MVRIQVSSSCKSSTWIVKARPSGESPAQTVPGVAVIIQASIASPYGSRISMGIVMKPELERLFFDPRITRATAKLERTISDSTTKKQPDRGQQMVGAGRNGRIIAVERAMAIVKTRPSTNWPGLRLSLSRSHKPNRIAVNNVRDGQRFIARFLNDVDSLDDVDSLVSQCIPSIPRNPDEEGGKTPFPSTASIYACGEESEFPARPR